MTLMAWFESLASLIKRSMGAIRVEHEQVELQLLHQKVLCFHNVRACPARPPCPTHAFTHAHRTHP
jgi:hypothetical protein